MFVRSFSVTVYYFTGQWRKTDREGIFTSLHVGFGSARVFSAPVSIFTHTLGSLQLNGFNNLFGPVLCPYEAENRGYTK